MAEKDPLIGEVLAGDFRVVRRLGFGGYARVYLAEQLSVGRRQVAIKVPHWMHLDQSGQAAVAALKREAAYLAMLKSPIFPRILRTGVTEDGRPFFAMEFVSGRTLDVLLKERKVLPVDRVVFITDAICDGLAEMHGRDIVHRDLKTGNIAIEESPPGTWRVRLFDLGSAKPLTEGAAVSTSTGRWRPGSPPYLAPESVRGGIFTERSDIYSLAAVAYELLCGVRAIHLKDSSPEAYISYLESDQPIPTYRIGTLQPGVPEALECVIHQALSRDPAARFSSAYHFREALRQAVGFVHGAPPPDAFGGVFATEGARPSFTKRTRSFFDNLWRSLTGASRERRQPETR